MSSFRDRVETAVQIIAEQLRRGPPTVHYVPGSGYGRRAVQRARELCRQGLSSRQAAQQSLRENQRHELALVAKAIEPSARTIATRFRLIVDELVNESLVCAMPTITRKFVPPFSSEGPEALFDRLRGYVRQPVYCTALAMTFTRRRRVYNLNEEVLDQLDSDLDFISEIELRDELVTAYNTLLPWLLEEPERHRRLQAIVRCDTLVEAAEELGVSDFALRQWLYKLRKLVQRLLANQ